MLRHRATQATILLGAIDGAKLVAVGIAYIGQVQRPCRAVAQSRRVFDGGAAVRNGRVVELNHLFRRFALEANGAAVGKGRLFAVDGLADPKGVAVVSLEKPGMPGSRFAA